VVARGSADSPLTSVVEALVPIEINFSLGIYPVTMTLLIEHFIKYKLLCILKVTYEIGVECSTLRGLDKFIHVYWEKKSVLRLRRR
jgi:hypothetical protein